MEVKAEEQVEQEVDNTKNIDYLRHQMITKGIDYGFHSQTPSKPNPHLPVTGSKVSDHFLRTPQAHEIKSLHNVIEFYLSLPSEFQRLAGASFGLIFDKSKEGLERQIRSLKNNPQEDLKKQKRQDEVLKKLEHALPHAEKAEKLFFKAFKNELNNQDKVANFDIKKVPPEYADGYMEFQMKTRSKDGMSSDLLKQKYKPLSDKKLKKMGIRAMKEETQRVRDLRLGDHLVLGPYKVDKTIDEEQPVEENAAPAPKSFNHRISGDELRAMPIGAVAQVKPLFLKDAKDFVPKENPQVIKPTGRTPEEQKLSLEITKKVQK